MVLLLDDLHWADKPTLALLKHLVGGNSRQSLLMLGTYRDSELSRDHPLTVTLADLRSEEGVQRIVLKGLGEGDVVSIMEAAAGREMDTLGRRLAADIAGETDGNPFFVSELLRHLIESGRLTRREDGRWELEGDDQQPGLPQSVREVVGRRDRAPGRELAECAGGGRGDRPGLRRATCCSGSPSWERTSCSTCSRRRWRPRS